MNNLLTTKELREKLSVSNTTLERFRSQGMPYLKLGYSTIRYELDKVYEWITDRQKQKAAESE